ncbi:hypothetical protein [Micromonospora purpureochromogenes]
MLVVHPLVLGTGRRLFPDSGHPRLTLVESVTTTMVVVVTYVPA